MPSAGRSSSGSGRTAPPDGIGRGATKMAVRVGFEPPQGIDSRQLIDSTILETREIRPIRCIVTPDYTQTHQASCSSRPDGRDRNQHAALRAVISDRL